MHANYLIAFEKLTDSSQYEVTGRYHNSGTKLQYLHKTCGRTFEMRPNGFRDGNRCPHCHRDKVAYNTQSYSAKLKREFSGEFILKSEYKNSASPVTYFHKSCNREFIKLPNSFTDNPICPLCYQESLTLDETIAEKRFKLRGYTLLSKFSTVKNKVRLRHDDCGYEYEQLPANFFKGNGCPKCANHALMNYTPANFLAFFDKNFSKRYTLISEYKTYDKELILVDKQCGTKFRTTARKLLTKQEVCPSCRKRTHNEVSPQEFADKFKTYESSEEYRINNLHDYLNNRHDLIFTHKKCNHVFAMSAHNFQRGQRCPKCARKGNSSKAELEVKSFIESIYSGKVEKQMMQVCDPYIRRQKNFEIDIYLPDKKIGIDYHGLRFHSTEKIEERDYHYEKYEFADKAGIRLIQIFEDEWFYKKEIVKTKIAHIIQESIAEYKVYARDCYIRELSNLEKRDFLDRHHIQGSDRSILKLGMFTKGDDELVSVLTIGNPRKIHNQKKTEGCYELSRFASHSNYIVIGGFSKLLNYFKTNYDFDKLFTFADLRWSVGNVYEKHGFKLSHQSAPSYSYWHKKHAERYQRLHRWGFRKSSLLEKFPDIENQDELTEEEIMLMKGYYRIYDCGMLHYILENK